MSVTTIYNVNELRLYQTPNLLQELDTVTISAPAARKQKFAAQNLIENLGARTSGNTRMAIIDADDNRATYESCYSVRHGELSSLGNLMEMTFNLGKSYFVHSVLVVQDLEGNDKPNNNYSS